MNKFICILAPLTIALSLSADQIFNTNIVNDWPNDRYTINNDGTVTDNLTNLMWLQCSLGQDLSNNCSGDASTYTWQEALVAAYAYELNSNTDWRLPNIKELESLVAIDRYDPAINSTVFPNTSSAKFWSSSPSLDVSTGAWRLGFTYGQQQYGARTEKNHVRLVRLVRSSQ